MFRFSISVCLIAGLVPACAVDGESEGMDEQAIDEASCGSATADFVVKLSHSLGDPPPPPQGVVSPTTYDNAKCDRAWVLDLVNSPFDDTQANIPMAVEYAGPRVMRLGQPTNEIPTDGGTCRSIRMRAVRYTRQLVLSPSPPHLVPVEINDLTTAASWIPFRDQIPGQPEQGTCLAPANIALSATPVGFGEQLTIQVTKNSGSSVATVKVRLKANI
jgi:hypothetical protein